MLQILGLYGATGSGKDTIADIINESCEAAGIKSATFKFATPVYELASVILGVTVEMLGERSTKEIPQWFHVTQEAFERAADVFRKYGLTRYEEFHDVWPRFEHEHLYNMIDDPIVPLHNGEVVLYSIYISPRQMLQFVGTELGRDRLHKDVWLTTLMRSINESQVDVAIVSDMRFPNEGALIIESNDPENGLITSSVHVIRPNNELLTAFNHASEQVMPAKFLKQRIVNDGSVLDLVDTVNEALVDRIIGNHEEFQS